jgi:hypothetical protein
MVGHTGASKTSTALALIEGAGREGPAALGVPAFSPTEATVLHLRTLDPDIFGTFRRREPLRPTDPGHHPPLEFVTTLGDNRPLTVLLHDVAGEDLMDPDRRVQLAPMTLWADTIIFIYNPENSPSYERNTEPPAPDQAVILNGVRDDLEVRGTHDASGRRYADPLLIVAVSKADLVDPGWGLRDGPACESEVKETLRSLGDGAVVTAASRWPEVRWRFIAPHPPSGESQGVLELFGECLQHARR